MNTQKLNADDLGIMHPFSFFLALSLGTGGFYAMYWQYALIERINREAGRTVIEGKRYLLALGLNFWSWYVLYLVPANPQAAFFALGMIIAGLWFLITTAFRVAKVLTVLTEEDEQWRFSPLPLLLFNSLYIYYVMRHTGRNASTRVGRKPFFGEEE